MRKKFCIIFTLISIFSCTQIAAQDLANQELLKEGIDLLRAQRYDEAAVAFSKAIDVLPESADAYTYRGTVWSHKEDWEKAVVDFNKAMEIDPRHANAYDNRGRVWYTLGDCARAVDEFKKAFEFDPNIPGARNQLAWMLAICPDERFRDGSDAVNMALDALNQNRGANTLDTLAAAYAQAGRFGEAVKTQEEAIARLEKEGSQEMMEMYEKHLRAYKARKPWRERRVAPEKETSIALYLESWRRLGNVAT